MKFKNITLDERALDREEAFEILRKGSYGILSTMGDDGYPYGVPLNYTCLDDEIYFHSAGQGHKLENIRHIQKVCFCVVTRSAVLSREFDTDYESVIAFGKAVEVCDDVQKERFFMSLLNKYSEAFIPAGLKYMKKYWDVTTVIKINIDHITGKACKN